MAREIAPGLPLVPTPWDVRGEGWIYPLYTPFSPDPIPLDPAAYSPFERGTSFDLSQRYHGGVGMVMIVRYQHGPAGPYDELLYIPGLFSHEDAPTEYFLSNTRIYVSTDVSVANGRKEWGIPKHRANFSFEPVAGSPSKTHLKVSHPSSPSTPFFSAILCDSKVTPFAIPVSTKWLEWKVAKWLINGYEPTLIQPPLPSALLKSTRGEGADASERGLEYLQETQQTLEAIVGTDGQTLAFTPVSSGRSRLSYLESARPPRTEGSGDRDQADEWTGFGDGVGFPKFEVTKAGILGGRGVHLVSFEMHIPAQVRVEIGKKGK
ncbi:hypothetical protein JCM10212_006661 [Sporobolomyces blumeae]